jgi:flagellar hook-associated protein 1 FlgK
MSTGFINTGVTGLQVAQLGLAASAHNITNADTAGYNRQRIVQESNLAMMTGAGFVGQGAHVATIERMYDRFLNGQVSSAQTQVSELASYHSQVSQIDNMLADANSGLSSALKQFFAGVQDVATNPSQVSSRQALVSSAQSLVSRFQALDAQLAQIYDNVNGLVTSTVSSINTYTKQIGSINEQIIVAQATGSQPANDLLDQRDQLVSELNKLVKVSTTTNTDGSYNVFVGTGQQLVVGSQVSTMTAEPASSDATRVVVGLKTPSGNQELPESLVNGGSLGGLLRFRSESLDGTANQLGREAASLALTFNAQNALGQDLLGRAAGETGFMGDLFTLGTPTVIASSSNAPGSPKISVDFTKPPPFDGNFYTDLTGSDYRLDYSVGNLTLTRLSDNKTWSAVDTVVAGVVVTAIEGINAQLALDPQGFSLGAASFTVANEGASYLIEPTRNTAGNITLNAAIAADPRLIAAAAPIRTAPVSTNSGNAVISAGIVATGYAAPSAGYPVTFTYSSVTNAFTGFPPGVVSVTSGGTTTDYTYPTVATSIPYTSGATITFSGISVEVSGTPSNGDSFSISRNTAASTDGRNALLLGKLQTQNTMAGHTATYQSAYAQLVSEVGNKTREVLTTGAAQEALLQQTTAARESLSGVNLDEEAANMIKYQQAYQASAKVIEMASKLFDSILAIN